MTGDVVSLDNSNRASLPATGQIQVVRAFASYVLLTDVVLVVLSVGGITVIAASLFDFNKIMKL
jgi:hypothetical protein